MYYIIFIKYSLRKQFEKCILALTGPSINNEKWASSKKVSTGRSRAKRAA